jgi:hypothetical protein
MQFFKKNMFVYGLQENDNILFGFILSKEIQNLFYRPHMFLFLFEKMRKYQACENYFKLSET